MHSSFVSLGKDLRLTFDDLVKQLDAQQAEAEKLRRELSGACSALIKANEASRMKLRKELAEEKQKGAEDRAKILQHMTAYMSTLLDTTGAAQEARMEDQVDSTERELVNATSACQRAQEGYEKSMDAWMHSERAVLAGVLRSRDGIKSKIKTDWTVSATCHLVKCSY